MQGYMCCGVARRRLQTRHAQQDGVQAEMVGSRKQMASESNARALDAPSAPERVMTLPPAFGVSVPARPADWWPRGNPRFW